MLTSEATPCPTILTEAKPIPISKKNDNVKLGHPLPSPSQPTIQTRKVIQLGQPSSKTANPATVQLDHPYTEPKIVLTHTSVPSENSDWNRPSTSRAATNEGFSLDFVKELQHKARYHEKDADELRKVNQRLLHQNKELRARNKRLETELYSLRRKFKTLKDQELSQKERADVIRECLKPFFKPVQIELFIRGDWKNVNKWDDDSCRMALTLRCMSKNVYDYLYRLRIIPLPHKTTLRRRFHHFQIPEGVKTC